MAVTTKTLYDTDFAEWAKETAELVRAGRLNEVDLEHVAEEIEDLAKSDRRAAASQMRRLMLHVIKQQVQPERDCASWQASVANAQLELKDILADSPSLRRVLAENLEKLYSDAMLLASKETGISPVPMPQACPFTLEELLSR
jgi:hypothetical protein